MRYPVSFLWLGIFLALFFHPKGDATQDLDAAQPFLDPHKS
jgi:hypothetical protein